MNCIKYIQFEKTNRNGFKLPKLYFNEPNVKLDFKTQRDNL